MRFRPKPGSIPGWMYFVYVWWAYGVDIGKAVIRDSGYISVNESDMNSGFQTLEEALRNGKGNEII